jgi:hypothetical protein
MNVRRKLIAVALGAGLALTGFAFAGGGSTAKPASPAQAYPTTTTNGY